MGRTRPTIGNKQQRAKIWAREKTQKREEKDKRKEQRRKKRSRQHDLLRDGGELGDTASSYENEIEGILRDASERVN